MGKPRRGGEARWAGQCGLMCGVQLAPDTGTGREAAGPTPATTIVFSGSLGVQQTQGDRSQCGTSPVTGARGSDTSAGVKARSDSTS